MISSPARCFPPRNTARHTAGGNWPVSLSTRTGLFHSASHHGDEATASLFSTVQKVFAR